MRTASDEAKTREQVEAIFDLGNIGLSLWEWNFIVNHHKWIGASKAPFWTDGQAAKIEQIWKERCK